MTDSFECFQRCLAEFEKNWKTPKAVVHLEEALEIYNDLESKSDDRFDNLVQRYGRNLEKEAKELFDSSEVESDQFVNREFSKTISKELSLFTQFQSIEERFGRPIMELICLLNLSNLNKFFDVDEDTSLNEQRQNIHSLSNHQLSETVGALRKLSGL